MSERSKTRKKELIKTIAIIFLATMLVLTFFSNTIMNYSLPQVATQYIMGGNISTKIRGTGTIEATEPRSVEIKTTRTIERVAHHRGDVVEAGEILYYLEDGDSSELLAAKETLESLQKAYDAALLSPEVTTEIYAQVTGGKTTSAKDYRKNLEKKMDAVASAQKKVDEKQSKLDELNEKLASLEASYVDSSAEEKAVEKAQAELNAAQAQVDPKQTAFDAAQATYDAYGLTVTEAQTAYDAALSAAGGDTTDPTVVAAQDTLTAVKNAYNAYVTARDNLTAATNAVTTAQTKLTTAQKALADKLATAVSSTTLSEMRVKILNATNELDKAQASLAKAQADQNDYVARIALETSLTEQLDAIKKQKKIIADLENQTVGTTVEAPISGRIIDMYYNAGQTVNAGEVVCMIQPADDEFKLSFTVTKEQAQRVSIGDFADISNSWYYYDLKAKLTAIKTDPQNPSKNKILEFTISGSDATAGDTLTLSVGEKNAYYDYVVPNTAIHEDRDGKFVLVVTSKSSPLGNRYFATRVDVTVLGSDDTQTAVSGGLNYGDYVITTSSKPIGIGKQVRLTEN